MTACHRTTGEKLIYMRKFEIIAAFSVLLILHSCTVPESNNKSVNTKVASAGNDSTSAEKRKKVILFFGNSITAGYGLESDQAFTTLIQSRLDSMGAEYEVINAGVSGETTASGSSRVGWVIAKQPIDIFVLELGANDGLRGVPVSETRKNLENIIDQVRSVHPEVKIILAGMMIPPSMGNEYSMEFQKIFPELAKSKNTLLIPFILNNVAGIDTLNLPDGIHPNEHGEKIVMENVWDVLKEILVY